MIENQAGPAIEILSNPGENRFDQRSANQALTWADNSRARDSLEHTLIVPDGFWNFHERINECLHPVNDAYKVFAGSDAATLD